MPDSPSARKPFRLQRRDIAIGAGVILLLAVLAFLFLRPAPSPARRLVFGDLPSPTQPPGSAVAPSASSPSSPPSSGSASPSQPFQASPASGGGVAGGGSGNGSGFSPGGGQSSGGGVGALINVPDAQTQPTPIPGGGVASSGASAGSPTPGGSTRSGSGPSAAPGNGGLQRQPDADLGALSTTGAGAGAGAGLGGAGASPPPNAQPGSDAGSAGAAPAAAPGSQASAPGQSGQPAPANGSSPSGFPASAAPLQSTSSAQPNPANSPSPGTRQNPNSGGASADTPSDAAPDQVAKETTADLLQVPKNDPQSGTAGAKPADADTATTPPAQPANPDNSATPTANPPNPDNTANPAANQPDTNNPATPATAPPDTNAAPGSEGGAGMNTQDKDPGPKPDTSHPFEPQRGSNVVFVLDHSLSMHGEKSTRARRELVDTLEHLGTNKSFYVIFFPYKAMPAPGPLPATPENIQSMTNWIYSLGHALGSDPTKALERALQFNPDTVWLLSDGKFSPKVPQAIRAANESVKAQVHTIGFYERTGEQVLRQIADENGGTYRFVPPPQASRSTNDAQSVAAPK